MVTPIYLRRQKYFCLLPSSAHQVNDRHRRANNIYSHDQSLVTRSEVFSLPSKDDQPLYKWLLTLFTFHNFYNWVSTAPSSSAPRPPLCVDPPKKVEEKKRNLKKKWQKLREGFKKSKWKFKMAFAMKGGGSQGGLVCHLPILKNDFLKNHLESFPDCENVFCT